MAKTDFTMKDLHATSLGYFVPINSDEKRGLIMSAFKKYRLIRKNVLLLAQAIINVHGKIAWQDYASDRPYLDRHSLTLNEIKGSPEKLERFRNEFAHEMYSNVINAEMQRLEHEL